MKITILTDNMTRIDAYYIAEPGISYYLECDGKKFLYDTGYSDIYVQNAKKLGIDLSELDGIVFSHGHNDHTGGLIHLPKGSNKIPVYAHPETFHCRIYEGNEIGSPMKEEDIKKDHDLILSTEPVFLTKHLVFLGQIPRENDFESKEPVGTRLFDGNWVPDFLPDDSALVYIGKEGLTIISGCSHSGICNVTEYAKKVCNENRIAGILGGFHLLEMTDRVNKTIDYLKEQNPKFLAPCHCTCFHVRAAINNSIPVTEVCVGDVFKFDEN